MSKRPARGPLKVTVMFEDDRFASENLTKAYELLVPPNIRKKKEQKASTTTIATSAMRRES